ncbi:MAG: 30S ribosomal protein S2 [Candidatus Woesearchaeota archaeon]
MSDETLLIDSKIYLKSGIHIGTKFQTKYMNKFIYKIRSDGLKVLNLQQIDERINVMINFLSQYEPEEILFVCRRENGWKSVKKMSEMTGIKVIAGRYPPGIMTNPNLKNYVEKKILIVADPWPDRNAINDAMMIGIPVIGLCDTNNQSNNLDLVIPCNNKGKKSLGLLVYLVTRGYMVKKGMIKSEKEFKAELDDFSDE